MSLKSQLAEHDRVVQILSTEFSVNSCIRDAMGNQICSLFIYSIAISQLFINFYCDNHGYDRLPQGGLMTSKQSQNRQHCL